MKNLILTALALMSFAVSAQAKTERLYVLDFTGKHFQNNGFNLMEDGIDLSRYTGIGLKVDGHVNDDFTVTAKPSEASASCAVSVAKTSESQTILRLEASVETDTGETCDFEVVYKNGRKATMSIVEEGT